jgi:hypothetical protein
MRRPITADPVVTAIATDLRCIGRDRYARILFFGRP